LVCGDAEKWGGCRCAAQPQAAVFCVVVGFGAGVRFGALHFVSRLTGGVVIVCGAS